MNRMKSMLRYFSRGELALWLFSMLLITVFFFIFDRVNYMTLAASLIGATSLIFCAKGNPLGQILMILFGVLYGIISYRFTYYGEVVTYLGMTTPMAVVSLVAWLRNPYHGNRTEVEVHSVGRRETALMLGLAIAVTFVFYLF